jgi:hypothetical protein
MEVLCRFSKMIENVGIIGDRMRQLVESGEYWMGILSVVWIVNSELQGGSPRLSWLRTDRLNPVCYTTKCDMVEDSLMERALEGNPSG